MLPNVLDSRCDGLLDDMDAATALSFQRCAGSALGARRNLLALRGKCGKMVACLCGKVLWRTSSADWLYVCDVCGGDKPKSTLNYHLGHTAAVRAASTCTPCLDWVADVVFAGLEPP